MNRKEIETLLTDHKLEFLKQPQETLPRISDLTEHLKLNNVITVITGVRRCGKSIFLKQIFNKLFTNEKKIENTTQVFVLNLDDPRTINFDLSTLNKIYDLWSSNFKENIPKYFFIDEIQNITGWEQWISYHASKDLNKFFITGSNAKMLSSNLATHLTGRYLTLHLKPLSFNEIVSEQMGLTSTKELSSEQYSKLQSLYDLYKSYGGFPRAYLDKTTALLPEYYFNIIIKDICFRNEIKNSKRILELATILATDNGRLINKTKISSALGIKDQSTVKKYIEYFKQAYLFSEIRMYSSSFRKQLRSLSKLYSVDQKMAFENGSKNESSSLENMVYNHLEQNQYDIFYYHTKNNREVDFILTKDNKVTMAIQVSRIILNEETLKRETSSLKEVEIELGISNLILVVEEISEFHQKQSDFIEKLGIKVIKIVDFLLGEFE